MTFDDWSTSKGQANAKICCSYCRAPLDVEVYRFLHQTQVLLCRSCFQGSPQCHNCGMPVEKTVKGEKTHYCRFCRYHGTCDSCGKEMPGSRSRRISGVRGNMCDECASSPYYCHSCHIRGNHTLIELGDGRMLCPTCYARAVMSNNEARRLHDIVLDTLRSRGFPVQAGYAVQLAEIDAMNLPGNEYTVRGFYNSENRTIYAPVGLTQEMTMKVMAHEYGHHVQYMLHPGLDDHFLREGFAQWVASVVLRVHGLYELFYSERTRPDDYGRGLRYFLELEGRYGFHRVTKKLQELG